MSCPPLHEVKYRNGEAIIDGIIRVKPWIANWYDRAPQLIYRITIIVPDDKFPRWDAKADTLPDAIDVAMRLADKRAQALSKTNAK